MLRLPRSRILRVLLLPAGGLIVGIHLMPLYRRRVRIELRLSRHGLHLRAWLPRLTRRPRLHRRVLRTGARNIDRICWMERLEIPGHKRLGAQFQGCHRLLLFGRLLDFLRLNLLFLRASGLNQAFPLLE